VKPGIRRANGTKRPGFHPGYGFLALLLTISAGAACTPGRFDYWLLSLSWSPQYCATAQIGRASCRERVS
jgi:ribonuclease I